ncbi:MULTISPECIES: hypothetical protein [Aminobacterium]|uniref:hypothetical protein n=1 Tax=Aminobacterium TaxID=81466 RepID=UPI00257B5107|nr:hypothetical protein [Aminobacterium sp. UBA4987]
MKCERCGAEYSGDICLHCLWRMHWGDKIHDEPPQQRRMERAQLIAKVDNLDAVKGSCTIKGSSSTPYITTLTSCTCTDFKRAFKRKHTIPCKHIYCLAHELGIIDLGKISNVVITFNEDKKHKIDSLQEDSQKELYALLTRWIYGLDTGSWIYCRDESSHRELLSKEILQEVDSPERLLVLVHIRDLRQVLKENNLKCPRTKKETIKLVYSLCPESVDELKKDYCIVKFKEEARGIRGKVRTHLKKNLFQDDFDCTSDDALYWGSYIYELSD